MLAGSLLRPRQNDTKTDEGRADGADHEDDMSRHGLLPLKQDSRSGRAKARTLIQINRLERLLGIARR